MEENIFEKRPISPQELEGRYGVISYDTELTNTDTLLFRDYLSLQVRRDKERAKHGTPEVTSYEHIPVSYYDYEKEHRHIARNSQVINIIKNDFEDSSERENFVVVEVGAGVGRFGERLVKEMNRDNNPRFIYYPSDISEAAISEMQKKRLFPTFVSATHLPYAKESSNIIYAGEVIEHLTFPMFLNFLSESRRVLRNDGQLIITTPNYNSLPARDEKLSGLIPFNFDEQRNTWASEHVLPFTLNSYKEIIERFGFELTSVSTNNITWKIENGKPTEFTVYEKKDDAPDPALGDTLIISARKVNKVYEKEDLDYKEDLLRERFIKANEGRDYKIYDRSMDAATIAKFESINAHFPQINEGDVIVDAGSGTGKLTEKFAEEYRGAKVIGEDISGELMETANEERALMQLVLGDASTQVFPENSLKVKYFSTCGHEVESFGGMGRMKQAVDSSYNEIMNGGRLIIRDFIKPDGKEPIYMKIIANDGFDNPEDATIAGVLDYNLLSTKALLERFRLEFRGGNEFNYEVVKLGGEEFIKIDPEWAYEFYMRKDYTGNWRQEIKEKYSYWTKDEAIKTLSDAGFTDIKFTPESNEYIMTNRLNGKIGLFKMNSEGVLEDLPFPPTHMTISGSKPGIVKESSTQTNFPELNYLKLKDSIEIKEEQGKIIVGSNEFDIDLTIKPVKGSKKQVYYLKGEESRVIKLVRKDASNDHAVFKAMFEAIDRENILDLHNVPHMKILEKDPNGPPYRFYVQEAIPKGSVCAADLIGNGELTERDVKQLAKHINNFELGKTWQLDTNPFNWYRVTDENGESKMVYIDGKVYRYDENWEFKRIGLLQWIKPDYVTNLPNRTALIPKAKEFEDLIENWDKDDNQISNWWKKYLNPLLQPKK